MPHYVLMLCLRQDDQRVTETLLLPGESVVRKLSPMSLAVLQQKRFSLSIEDTLNLDNVSAIPEAFEIFKEEQPGGAWRINLDSSFVRPARDEDDIARAALAELLIAAEMSFESVRLETGDLIIWDNTRVSHDRQFNGANRWLERTHAYTGSVSPFHMFQNIGIQFVKGGDPFVVQTKGVFHRAFSNEEL